jgi:hypothetical protein
MSNSFFLFIALFIINFQLKVYAERNHTCLHDSVPQLSEIIISGIRKSVIKKNDTIVYRVDAFKNGNEKSLEELLAKIPGMKVDPYSGQLSYFGRTIQAVKLDGADLTGSDYVNLTRNISSDLIDEVEAIDNDPENPLLKEVRPSGKMVLNLKLKKGGVRFNGEASAALGNVNDQKAIVDIKSNLLRLSQKIKSFMSAGVNNRGMNYGSYNYFDNQDNDKNQDREYELSPLIASSVQVLLLPAHRYFINQNYMMNGNFMIQPKTSSRSVRLNLYGMTDHLRTQYGQSNQFRPETKIPPTSDHMDVRIKPLFYKTSLEWRQWISPKIWMQYAAFAEQNYRTEDIRQLLNRNLIVNSLVEQGGMRHHHQWDFSYSIHKLMVFRALLKITHHNLKEQMSWDSLSELDSSRIDQKQDIRNGRRVVEGRMILSAKQKKFDYDVEIGFIKMSTNFHSVLYGTGNLAMNQIRQNYVQAYQTGTARFDWAGWVLKPRIKIAVNNFQLSHLPIEKHIRSLPGFEPELSISKKISDLLNCVNVFSISNRTLSDRPFFEYPVWVSAREVCANRVMPDLQNVIKFQSMLICQDMFRQLHGQINLSYVRMNQSVVPDMSIDARRIQTKFSLLKTPLERSAVQASAEKFIPKLGATLALECHYSKSYYYNIINDKDLRKNTIHVLESSLKINKNLQKNLKVLYDFKFINNHIHTSIPSRHILGQISESLQVICQKSKKGFIRLIAERYRPQLSSTYSILFLDGELMYKPVGRKYSCSIVGKNLLNHQYIQQVQISDYGNTEMITRLMPAYLMLEWSYRF